MENRLKVVLIHEDNCEEAKFVISVRAGFMNDKEYKLLGFSYLFLQLIHGGYKYFVRKMGGEVHATIDWLLTQ